MLNAEKIYKLLFDLLGDQEGLDITFTMKKVETSDQKEEEEKE